MSGNLSVTPKGDLLIPKNMLGKLKGKDPAEMRVTRLYDDLLLTAHAQPGQRAKPLLFGDLRLFNVGELMALISSMHKDGSLTLLVPHARKTMIFSGGKIVYASSNVEDDRLGEVLWRQGYLSLDQLSTVHDLVGPGRKLGSLLMEKEMITPRQLYEGIKSQVLEIVYSTFHFRVGEFLFAEGKVRLKGTVRLDMSTQEVMMEGIQRMEEMTRLDELFPDRESVLFKRPLQVEVDLDEPGRVMFGLIDGRRSVSQIIEASHLGELDALKALAKLRRIGFLDVREHAVEDERDLGPLPDVLKAYRLLLRQIHQTLAAEVPESVARVEAFLGSPGPEYERVFANVGFDDLGMLDMDTLYRNARAAQPDSPRELALAALRSFYDYAQFQAMDVLEDDACDQMVNKLRKIRSRIKE